MFAQKAKEAMGYQKTPGNESQEPAGVMENRSKHIFTFKMKYPAGPTGRAVD